MPTTHPLPTAIFSSPQARRAKPKGRDPRSSGYVVDEINAYIAIRDSLLMEAEQMRTSAKLDSVMAANDFVETCLRPARPVYASQHLPENDAVRERARCQAVKTRVAELRRKSA